jgi:hypothetical protein
VFAGHVGAALAIGRAERRVNIGVFVTASLLLDLLLWLFVLLGLETVTIPPSFASTRQAEFVFPYSHGLLASVLWSVLAVTVGFFAYSRLGAGKWVAALLIGAAVFSHWLLDVLVHQPEMPLVSTGSLKVGFSLWQSMPIALIVEAAIVVLGLYVFVRGSILSRGRSIALTALSLVILAFTVVGMTVAPRPPSPLAMAGSSLATLLVVCLLFLWLGKIPHVAQA